MKATKTKKLSIVKLITLASAILFISTNSLAELNQVKKVYTQKGYPYEGLVARSEKVTILYREGTNNISCRVEVLQNGQLWKGGEHKISLKKFTQKPLRACMDRNDAKKLLANTF